MKPGYLRKNGVPYSANAVLAEYFQLLTDEADKYLAVDIDARRSSVSGPALGEDVAVQEAARRHWLEPDSVLCWLKPKDKVLTRHPLSDPSVRCTRTR